mgnify:CR=1 FL=1
MMILFFIFGLFLGSLLNTIALRLETKERIIFSRSHCPKCGKILNWYELIPIVSFIIQKGKCRSCQTKIDLRYPLIEIVTGLFCLILAISLKTKFNLISLIEYVYYLVPLSILFIEALYDLKTYYIDNRLLLIMGLWFAPFYFLRFKYPFLFQREFSYLFNYFFNFNDIFIPFISAFLGFFFIFLIYLITFKKGIGIGDAFIIGILGLYFKPGDLLLILILSSFWGSIIGFFLKFVKNKRMLPFVPFIFIGTLSLLIFGKLLTFWYFTKF